MSYLLNIFAETTKRIWAIYLGVGGTGGKQPPPEAQPLFILSGKRENDAMPAQKHKTCAAMTNPVAQGRRKPAPTSAVVALVRADQHKSPCAWKRNNIFTCGDSRQVK